MNVSKSMYQTLYRKYRPQKFADVVGQKHVTQLLRNSIRQEKISHAYLFGGPRGTGKTSAARIFAKALNCENGKDGDACGVCEVCTSIAENRAPDFIEIDAASNRGIDDIRDLRERVHYAPLRFRYKVYIIDEAHMITDAAFNALLKTLEEPPPHVILILCTTLPHKLPLTILSRTLKFDFYRLPLQLISNRLKEICKNENVSITDESALELAKLSEGSVRDAISLLEQAIVYSDGVVTKEKLDELFHLVNPQRVIDLAVSLILGRNEEVSATSEEIILSGRDPERVLLELADVFEKFLLNRTNLRNATQSRNIPYPEVSDTALISAISECWEASNRLRREANPTLLLRITLFRLVKVLSLIEATTLEPFQSSEGKSKKVRANSANAPAPSAETLPIKSPIDKTSSSNLNIAEAQPSTLVDTSRNEISSESKPTATDELLSNEETDWTDVTEDDLSSPPFPEFNHTKPSEELPEHETGKLFELPEKLKIAAESISGSAIIGGKKPKAESLSASEASLAEEETESSALFTIETTSKPEAQSSASYQPSSDHSTTDFPDSIANDERWRMFLADVRKESITTFCIVFDAPIPFLRGEKLVLRYPYHFRYFVQLASEASNMRIISHFAKKHFGEVKEVVVEVEDAGKEIELAEKTVAEVKSVFPEAREVDLV